MLRTDENWNEDAEHAAAPQIAVTGTATSTPQALMKQFVIPPLQVGERIEEWKPVFTAAVTSLLSRPDGQKLAIGLLPGHVNRRPAERELVKEAVQKATLEEAFEVLSILDDPVDACAALQRICR